MKLCKDDTVSDFILLLNEKRLVKMRRTKLFIIFFLVFSCVTIFLVINKYNSNVDLILATEKGDLLMVKKAIANRPNINTTVKYGVTPLLIASQEGYTKIIEVLLKEKADVNVACEESGLTPLYMASQLGHTDIVKLLLEAKAYVNTANKITDATPLWMASQLGHTEIVKLLLEARADVNTVNTKYGSTPLYMASQNGHIGVVRLLLKENPDVHIANKANDLTSLQMASQSGYSEIVKLWPCGSCKTIAKSKGKCKCC